MERKSFNSCITISQSTSLSIMPSREYLLKSHNSACSSRFLIEECMLPLDLKSSERASINKLENCSLYTQHTLREFEDIDTNAPTLRNEAYLMCVNCFEYLLIDNVDSHSIWCTVPEESQEKVIEALGKLLAQIREYKLDASAKYILALIQLEEICKMLIENCVTFNEAFERINLMMSDYRAFPFVLMLVQRLERLVEGLCEVADKLHTASANMNAESRQISLEDHKDSFISINSPFFFDFSGEKTKAQIEEPNDFQEKFFYSQCIKKKMMLSPKNPSKNLPIFQLYQECLEQQIPVPDWGDFIDKAFEPDISITVSKEF